MVQKTYASPRAAEINRRVESVANTFVRGLDRTRRALRVGGRKARYDDACFEFEGGARDRMRRRTYDKSLRLLWKAETETPFLGFRDASVVERQMREAADRAMTDEERAATHQLTLPAFRAFLDSQYSRREKEAIVAILAAIGHGEAYAWLVAAELLGTVDSTGARAALSMQVIEEAKHFVVLRELVRAFDVPVPRQSAWEYLLLEGVLKSDGLEKFFGMNVLVEGIALSFFGLMSHMPGLEVLRLFHLDEARHAALPGHYLKEFPLTAWQKHNPLSRVRRLKMVLPALGLIPLLEADMAELGIDAFEFGGSVIRKVSLLAHRHGFFLPIPHDWLMKALEEAFNGYCRLTRPAHEYEAFMQADTTRDANAREVERGLLTGAA